MLVSSVHMDHDKVAVQVTTATHKIASETEEANSVAAECQEALQAALPALAAAEEALNVLTKKDIAELKVWPTVESCKAVCLRLCVCA
jgi:dynein heavy chain